MTLVGCYLLVGLYKGLTGGQGGIGATAGIGGGPQGGAQEGGGAEHCGVTLYAALVGTGDGQHTMVGHGSGPTIFLGYIRIGGHWPHRSGGGGPAHSGAHGGPYTSGSSSHGLGGGIYAHVNPGCPRNATHAISTQLSTNAINFKVTNSQPSCRAVVPHEGSENVI